MDFTVGKANGQLATYLREKLEILKYPKIMRLDVAGSSIIILTDIEYIYSVVLSRTTTFCNSSEFFTLFSQLLGSNEQAHIMALTRSSTPYVKAVRKVFLSAFQSSQLKKAMPKLDSVMQNLIGVIESKRHEGPIDFQQLSVQFTLDTIGRVALDTNLGGLDGSRQIQRKLIEGGHVARVNALRPFHALYCKLFPKSKIALEQTRVQNALTAEWDDLVQEILQKDDPPEGEMPIWYALKTLTDPETGTNLARESLRGELTTTVIGGMDTLGHQLAWTLAMLASHPHIVEKLLEELREHGLYGENARELTFEDLVELDYLSAVISEGMRIVHIGPAGIFRQAPQDMKILGYRVPKGTSIMIAGNRSLMSKAVWNDPEVVRPERWQTDEDMTNKYFHVFSKGPRHCVGERLAMLELRYAIVKLITKYRLEMDLSFAELMENTSDGFVIEANGGIMLRALPRETSQSPTS